MKSVFFSAAAFVCLASTAHAQASRTWVSGVGDDANPCSRTAPCKTFAGTISKTAAGGEINVIDSGGFGAVTITKSIRIQASPFMGGILASNQNGIIINAGVNDVVTLKGLTIDGFNQAGTYKGIWLIQAGALIVEDCDIFGFGQRGISIAPTNDNVKVAISNTNVSANLSNGIVIQPTGANLSVTLDNVHVQRNTNYGISITSGSKVAIRNSTISNNGLSGLRIEALTTASMLELDGILISGNTTGIETLTGSTTHVARSSIVHNTTGISAGGSIQSSGNNLLVGNTAGNTGMALIGQQ